MSTRSAILLAAAVFVLTALVRLPAGILAWLLPAAVQCQEPGGTVWRGACVALRTDALTLSDVRWRLHAWPLLLGRVVLDVQSNDARAAGSARLALHRHGDTQIQSLHATLPLQGGISLVPAGWSGALELAIAQATVLDARLVSIQGAITVRNLHSEHPPADLGSFQLDFPSLGPEAPMVGTLRDLDGPLSLQGQLQLARTGAYEVAGSVGTREGASTGLQQMLQLLGPADAQGRHAFSLAGTL